MYFEQSFRFAYVLQLYVLPHNAISEIPFIWARGRAPIGLFWTWTLIMTIRALVKESRVARSRLSALPLSILAFDLIFFVVDSKGNSVSDDVSNEIFLGMLVVGKAKVGVWLSISEFTFHPFDYRTTPPSSQLHIPFQTTANWPLSEVRAHDDPCISDPNNPCDQTAAFPWRRFPQIRIPALPFRIILIINVVLRSPRFHCTFIFNFDPGADAIIFGNILGPVPSVIIGFSLLSQEPVVWKCNQEECALVWFHWKGINWKGFNQMPTG